MPFFFLEAIMSPRTLDEGTAIHPPCLRFDWRMGPASTDAPGTRVRSRRPFAVDVVAVRGVG